MESQHAMIRTPMKNGKALISPPEWILLNPDEAQQCTHACALYLYNGPDYGGPEAGVFFSNAHADEFSDGDKDRAFTLLEIAWPRFAQFRAMELSANADDEEILEALLHWMFNECEKAGYREFALLLMATAKQMGAKEFLTRQREMTGMQTDKMVGMISRFTDPTVPVHGFLELYPESYHTTYSDPAPCGAMIVDAGKEESPNA